MSTEVYRQTKLGDSLVSALEDLLDNGKITPDLAIKVLSEVSPVTQLCPVASLLTYCYSVQFDTVGLEQVLSATGCPDSNTRRLTGLCMSAVHS